MKQILLFISFMALSPLLFPQSAPQSLTLNQAIDMGVKNSKTLQGSRAKLEEATAAIKEAEQRKLPDVSVSASYLRVTNPTINLKTQQSGGGGAPDTTQTSSTPKVTQAAYGIANVSLPLYSGLRIKHGIEASKFLEQAARLDADNDREGVILNIVDAYNNLYKRNCR